MITFEQASVYRKVYMCDDGPFYIVGMEWSYDRPILVTIEDSAGQQYTVKAEWLRQE